MGSEYWLKIKTSYCVCTACIAFPWKYSPNQTQRLYGVFVSYIATIVCMYTMQQHYLQYTQTTLHPISQYSFKHVSIRQMPQSITFSWNPWPTGFSTLYSAHSKSSSIFYSNTYPHLMTPKQRQQSNAWP